jgi:hypothetical protein
LFLNFRQPRPLRISRFKGGDCAVKR